MATQEKKMAAAIAAVSVYMQQEEAVWQEKTAMALKPSNQLQAVLPNLWGYTGRQTMMQMRNLMQLKAFHRL